MKVHSKYRPNICTVIINRTHSKVLMFHRIGVKLHGWQFPQGGIDSGETEVEAFCRELKEEIGTNDVRILKTSTSWIRYNFPKWVRDNMSMQPDTEEHATYLGQQQRWFLAQLNQGLSSIHFNYQPAEFDQYRWVPIEQVLELVVPFKKKAYQKGLMALGVI